MTIDRRKFLKSGLLAAAGIGAGASAFGSAMGGSTGSPQVGKSALLARLAARNGVIRPILWLYDIRAKLRERRMQRAPELTAGLPRPGRSELSPRE